MPRNDFACHECEVVVEAGRTGENPPACPDCGEDMDLVFLQSPSVQVRKTPGWKDKEPHATESDMDELIEEYEDKDWEPSEQDIKDWEAVSE